MKSRLQPGKKTTSAWLALFPVLVLADCASTQQDVTALAAPEAPKISPERAAAVADIRRKAENARNSDDGSEVSVYQSFGPPRSGRMTYAEIRAIEAELDALAAATKRSSDPGEIAALRKQAAELEALRDQVELDGEAGSGSKSE